MTGNDLALRPGLAEALVRTFPDISPIEPLQVVGEGFRSLVVETPNGVILRVGKNAVAAEGYRRERQLLPLLRGRLPVAIPELRWYAPPSADLPFGALGYQKLPGTSLSPAMLHNLDVEQIAGELASFLVALHRVPIEELAPFGLTRAPIPEVAPDDLRQEGQPLLRSLLSAVEYQTVASWWESFLADPHMYDVIPTLRHGDLWYEHILIDGSSGRIAGILDFEEAAIGDPVQDLAVQLHLGRPFLDRVLDAYRATGGSVDDTLLFRTWRLWEAREVAGLIFAARHEDKAEVQDAVQKLRAGPVLNPATRC